MNEIIAPPRADTTGSTSLTVGSLLNFISAASRDPSVDVSKFESLLRMQREIIADDAKLQFNRAMAQVQREMTPVVRDANNEQTRSKYARLETIDAMMRPCYTAHGFSLSFDQVPSEDPSAIRISCEVAHEGGFSRTYHLESTLDSVGAKGNVNKTPLHALGSTMSYLRRYLTSMIFHVVLVNDDDDGNLGGQSRAGTPPPQRPPAISLWAEDAFRTLNREQNAWKWLDLLAATLATAPSLRDVETVYEAEGVQTARAAAPPEGVTKFDTAFAAARARFAAKPAAVAKAAVQPNPKTAAKSAPAFEAILVDAAGIPNWEPHTDPYGFAVAFMAHYDRADADQASALIEYNADALDEARGDPRAAKLLEVIDEPPAEDDARDLPSDRVIEPVQPPVERGKTSWVSYVKLLKADLGQVITADLERWVLAQRPILSTVPMGQRVLAIQAISTRFGVDNVPPPVWLAEMMRPSAAAQSDTSTGATIAATADERWASATIKDIDACGTSGAFDELVRSNAMQKVMARLKREDKPLFDRVDTAFLNKHKALGNVAAQG
jgi:hypothetical protein